MSSAKGRLHAAASPARSHRTPLGRGPPPLPLSDAKPGVGFRNSAITGGGPGRRGPSRSGASHRQTRACGPDNEDHPVAVLDPSALTQSRKAGRWFLRAPSSEEPARNEPGRRRVPPWLDGPTRGSEPRTPGRKARGRGDRTVRCGAVGHAVPRSQACAPAGTVTTARGGPAVATRSTSSTSWLKRLSSARPYFYNSCLCKLSPMTAAVERLQPFAEANLCLAHVGSADEVRR